ncbi:MAG: TonB-dependent receptor [Blastocatellia bacterium]|nr:TonB-dependent receptor [Blastocatellia bacterium]
MIRLFFCLITLSSLTLTGVAQQPTSTPTNGQPPEKTELPVIKDQVVVTATRDELSQGASPNSTSVVTLRENQIRNTSTVDQSLNLTEGVFAFRAKGLADNEARIVMRGFNGQNRTLTLLDGLPLNDAYTGNIVWTMIPVSEVNQVEVARGPFSSLYGGNAMGGVVNIRTRPIDRRSVEGSIQYGTFETTSYDARYSDRFWDKLGFSIGYRRVQTDGYSTRPVTASATTGTTGTLVTGIIPTLTSTGGQSFIIGASGNNWYNQHALRLKTELAVTTKTQISGQYIRQTSAGGYDASTSFVRDAAGNVIEQGPVLFNHNGTVRRFTFTPGSFLQIPVENDAHFVSAALLHKFNERTFLNFSGGFSHQPTSQFRSPTPATATQAGGPGTTGLRASRNTYFNAQLNWLPDALKRQHSFIFGAETRADVSDAQDVTLSNWQVRNSQLSVTASALGRTFNQAAYVQDQFRIKENITVVAGMRFDYWRTYDGFFNGFTALTPLTRYEPRSNRAVTGKVAAAWAVGRGFTVRSSLGTAFRNPSVFDMYRNFRFPSGLYLLANPDLKPEQLFSYEFGVRKTLGDKTALEATYYRNNITNLIYRQTDLALDPTGLTRINVNAGQGTTNGVELSLRQQLFSWLQFRTSYSYTDAKITENPAAPLSVGKRVVGIPTQMASGSLLGAWKRLSGSLSGRYVAATFSTDNNADTTRGVFGSYSPFFLADASFGVEIGRGFSVFSNIENLLNRQYYQFFLSPPRSANLGVRWRK